jgi:pimeloyl-ACP methyl ester carboxylesterase
MAAITPTLSDQVWGTELYQRFHYTAHPVRDDGGNPLLMCRHGGGGWGGWYDNLFDATDVSNSLFEFCLSEDRPMHFDIITFDSAQVLFTTGTTNDYSLARSRRAYIMEQARDIQRAVCAIKKWGSGWDNSTSYRINPNKIILKGHSHGSTICGLSQIIPPVTSEGDTTMLADSLYSCAGFDSRVKGVIYHDGQIDARSIGGTDYIDASIFPAWFGASYADDTEFDALPSHVRSAASLRAYIEAGDTKYWVPHLIVYNTTLGAHSYPLANAHDGVQLRDLSVACRSKGLSHRTVDLAPVSGDQATISGAKAQQVYGWMERTLADAANKSSSSTAYIP